MSRCHWPISITNTIPQLPSELQNQQKFIEKFFKKAYPHQQLQVLPNIGVVEVSISLKGVSYSFECSMDEYEVLMVIKQKRRRYNN